MSTLLIPIAVSSQLDVSGEERIHAATYTELVRPVWAAPVPDNIYAWLTGTATFAKSSDTGGTWPTTVSSGGLTNSAILTHGSNGRLFHFYSGGGKTTTNGTTWVDVVGIGTGGGYEPNYLWMLRTPTEWILAVNGGDGTANYVYVSTDGINFTPRTLPEDLRGYYVAYSGSTIIAKARYLTNTYVISTDHGVTWASGNTGTTFGGTGIAHIMATSAGFFAFPSVVGAGIQKSVTGAAGTWSTISNLPGTQVDKVLSAVNTDTGMVLLYTATDSNFGATLFVSTDNCATWNAGTALPANYTASRPYEYNGIIYSQGSFFFSYTEEPSTGSIYSTTDGVTVNKVYTRNVLDGISGFMVGPP